MPVGTKATVKAVEPRELRELGAQIVLGNTYHLYFRPGTEIVAAHGGLHGFMRGTGPSSPTPAGSRSSASRARASCATTAWSSARSTTARATCSPPSSRCASRRSSAPTSSWRSTSARRARCRARSSRPPWSAPRAGRRPARQAHGRRDQLLIGIVQGGVDEELRRRSAAEIIDVGFDAYAIGGLSVGERGDEMLATVELMDELLPGDRLRYFMGIGDPVGIVDVIARGVDVFDCVLPTRMARTGSAILRGGGPAQPAQRALRRRPGAARAPAATATRAARSRVPTCAISSRRRRSSARSC